jgi:hypothetical protein
MPSTNAAAIAAQACADRRYRRERITKTAVNALRKSISSILGCDESEAAKREAISESIAQCGAYLVKNLAMRGDDEEEKDRLFRNLGREDRGDDAERDNGDDDERADDERNDDGDGERPDHHASQVADMVVESGLFPDRASAFQYLMHSPHGAALLHRLRTSKAEKESPMTPIEKVIKDHGGVLAVCKNISVAKDSAGLTEGDITAAATAEARKLYPNMPADNAFAKYCSANPVVLEACDIAKQAAFVSIMNKPRSSIDAEYRKAMTKQVEKVMPITVSLVPLQVGGEDARAVNDPQKAIEQLQRLGADKWPSASAAQQFARAFSDPANRELAKKAHVRPSGHPSYPAA